MNELLLKFGRDFTTVNLNPGTKVYGERILKKGGKECRVWDPYRSKLAAALRNGLKEFPFKKDSKVLYLGAANGTTVSHISDLCPNGMVFGVEFSPKPMIDFYLLAQERKNIAPILESANHTDAYKDVVPKVDIIYEDVAQKTQLDILKKNAEMFLKKGGYVFLMIKARSIDVTRSPQKIFNEIANHMYTHFKVIERIDLGPFEKDHMCLVGKYE
jgi:fibrillarin-like pre-rRNA processing protein